MKFYLLEVDSFVEHILKFYQGDHLLLNALSYEKSPIKIPLSDLSLLNKNINEKSKYHYEQLTTKELNIKQDLFCDISSEELSDEENDLILCIACNNGDKPTGLHR